MRGEEGSALAGALALTGMLSIGALALMARGHSLIRLTSSIGCLHAREAGAEGVLESLTGAMQSLCLDGADTGRGEHLQRLLAAYGEHGLMLTDVSSGINRRLLCGQIISSRSVQEAIASGVEGTDMQYGWVHARLGSEEVIRAIGSYARGKAAFPLVNAFPPCNVHAVSEPVLAALLEAAGVKEPKDKAYRLKAQGASGELTEAELAELLGVSTGHPALQLVGSKTAFWKAEFIAYGCAVRAIYAAVPFEKEPRKVEKYILLEQRVERKGAAQ